ncbi:hypothetical protein Ocin01_16110 [Orchesella cincta]|uniref:Uncharacterized protein n=1 Tax=Orchesella cincta TaxID=48709 RepID=A0A1D2MCD5_ORCCI|nr:hypothetical protein Ocin01_16110 [Orchesella cincta]
MLFSNCAGLLLALIIAIGDGAVVSEPKVQLVENDSNSHKNPVAANPAAEATSSKVQLPGPSNVAVDLLAENETSEPAVRPSRADVTPSPLPKHVQLKYQTGRMLGASTLGIETPADDVLGRGMSDDDDDSAEEVKAKGSVTTTKPFLPTAVRGTSIGLGKGGAGAPQISDEPSIGTGGDSMSQQKPSGNPRQPTSRKEKDAVENSPATEGIGKPKHITFKKTANFTKTTTRNYTKGFDYEMEVAKISVMDEMEQN